MKSPDSAQTVQILHPAHTITRNNDYLQDMKQSEYCVEASSSLLKFEFHSEGPNGKIRKQVLFKAFDENPDVYNLGFGDVGADGLMNDTIISNNNDSSRILSTVALTILKFYEKRPDAYVFIMGNTPARTRLYRIGICNNLDKVSNDLYIFGLAEENVWELFKRDRPYSAFLIKAKNSTFDL